MLCGTSDYSHIGSHTQNKLQSLIVRWADNESLIQGRFLYTVVMRKLQYLKLKEGLLRNFLFHIIYMI